MTQPLGKSNRRLILEGGAIVLSILIAFGIEAAWEERGERVREREAIQQLAAEFEVVRQRLADAVICLPHTCGPDRRARADIKHERRRCPWQDRQLWRPRKDR